MNSNGPRTGFRVRMMKMGQASFLQWAGQSRFWPFRRFCTVRRTQTRNYLEAFLVGALQDWQKRTNTRLRGIVLDWPMVQWGGPVKALPQRGGPETAPPASLRSLEDAPMSYLVALLVGRACDDPSAASLRSLEDAPRS